MSIREQARQAVKDACCVYYEDSADVASDVWEPITAAYRLKKAGVDLKRLIGVLESQENWGHLVHAYEVLTVLGAVRLEMEAME